MPEGKTTDLTYKGAKKSITSEFFSETQQARKEWNEIFKV